MNKLGGVELSEHLYLEPEPRNMKRVDLNVRQTMGAAGGRAVITTKRINSGQEIKLVDRSEHGAFKGKQIDALEAVYLAGEEIVLEHHLGRWQVMISVFDVADSDGRCDPDDDSDYHGSITMIITKFL